MGLKPRLMRLASEAGIAQRVTWTGMLDDDMKEGAFRSAEVFVLPSHHESFGMVVAEALSRGLPVLISDKVNIWREVVADGAGFASNDDTDSAAKLLQRWAALSKDDRKTMSDSASKCFSKRFEIKNAAQHLQRSLGLFSKAESRFNEHWLWLVVRPKASQTQHLFVAGRKYG